MISLIWLIFSFIFLILSTFHFYISFKNIKTPENIPAHLKSVNGVSIGIAEFISYFREYINDVNKSNKLINIIQGFGYLVAFATSVYSYYLSLPIK